MKILSLDCSMGAAGDMLTAALYELLPEADRAAFLKKMNALGLPGVSVSAEPAIKCGITGTHFTVRVGGEEENSEDCPTHGAGHGHAHGHDHDHDDGHDHAHHHHTGMPEIRRILSGLPVPERVRKDVTAVYGLIAEAESKAHGMPVEQIHFHEVGTLDAVADITAVCLLMERLAPERVVCTPVHVGSGRVRCAHGIMPVPAPATAHILQGVPIYGGSVEGELCTPTGAALLKHFVTEFGPSPVLRTEAVGYGMGKKDFEAANCVRAMLGETEGETGSVLELSCNVDDMTAEQLGFAMERLFEGGALEVFTVPVGMKKSRPGTLLQVMCAEEDRERMLALLFRHTTTIGVREALTRRFVLTRRIEEIETPLGTIRKKISEGYGVRREKLEYEDLARIARETGKSLEEVRQLCCDVDR